MMRAHPPIARQVAACLLVAASARPALGAGPSKQECAEANESAQALRQQESLAAARAALGVCLAASCPQPIREDCAARLAEIDAVQPSLVFEVTDPSGQDVAGVTLRVDGKAVVSRVGGAAIPFDPGTHEVTLAPPSGPEVRRTIVVREGERARHVAVALEVALDDPGRTQRIAGIVLTAGGAAALLVGGVLGIVAKTTYDSAVSGDCAGSAAHCSAGGVSQIDTAHAQAAGATASVIAGGALLVGGVALWLTSTRSVHVTPTTGGASVVLRLTF